MISKKIFKDEIEKTKEAIQKIEGIKIEQKKNFEKLIKDCDVGLEINKFVLEKLEAEWKLM